MFDDHLAVESPGSLPGLVRTSNMREMHFSRNPKTVEFMQVYGYVKEFGEGVDACIGKWRKPGCLHQSIGLWEFILFATLKNQKWGAESEQARKPPVNEALYEKLAGVARFHVRMRKCSTSLAYQNRKNSGRTTLSRF